MAYQCPKMVKNKQAWVEVSDVTTVGGCTSHVNVQIGKLCQLRGDEDVYLQDKDSPPGHGEDALGVEGHIS